MTEKLVCITVCTVMRPEMFRRCLDSLVRQEVPVGWRAQIVVVENDSRGGSRDTIAGYQESSHIPVRYAVEPVRGIPFARNMALRLALDEDADWIAFVDDDEVVSEGWLAAFCDASEMLDADILMGPALLKYPPATPWWIQRGSKNIAPTGASLDQVFTYNTFMCADIVSPDGLGLRFDERLRFTGGEDKAFFLEAIAMGRVAKAVREAVVTEEVPDSRLTLGWQYGRMAHIYAHNIRLRVEGHGAAREVLKGASRALEALFLVPVMALLGIILFPVHKNLSGKLVHSALRKAARVNGYYLGIVNKLPQPYRSIQGS